MVDFDELTAMASEHRSLGPVLYDMTPVTISSGLVPNPPPSTPFVPPSRSDWDLLFQPMFDESLNPPPYVDLQAPEVIAPIPEVVALNCYNHDIEVAHMGNDPYFGIPIPEVASDQSSSSDPYSATMMPFLTSIEPKELQRCYNYKHVIEAMQEELYEFERLEVWNFFLLPDKHSVITLNSYGKNESPRVWYDMLSSFLISNDFSKGSVDPTLFIRREGKELLLVQIYVDDIIFAASTLELYGGKEGKAVDPSHYHGMIGTLLYLTASRPDLQFAICMCPDADHAGCQDTRRSTSGSITTFWVLDL
ncbi:retrovirus-related pol polyprotein from transposon TNT 1-94 [Tanacetum coccineum]